MPIKVKKKPRLKWEWSSYVGAYRATTNGYFFSVWLNKENLWRIEIQRYEVSGRTIVARCQGRKMLESTLLFAESRLLRLANENARRAARIQKLLGGS